MYIYNAFSHDCLLSYFVDCYANVKYVGFILDLLHVMLKHFVWLSENGNVVGKFCAELQTRSANGDCIWSVIVCIQ